MINIVTGWFGIAQYEDKIAVSIANLVEIMWLSIYPIPIEIMYEQRKEFICHKLIKFLTKMEYGITVKPSTSGNHMSNALL